MRGQPLLFVNTIILLIKMEVNQEEVTRLDSLGAHFKFRDLSARLRLGLQEHTQEKRSSDLLAYQAYFTQNEVVEVKRK